MSDSDDQKPRRRYQAAEIDALRALGWAPRQEMATKHGVTVSAIDTAQEKGEVRSIKVGVNMLVMEEDIVTLVRRRAEREVPKPVSKSDGINEAVIVALVAEALEPRLTDMHNNMLSTLEAAVHIGTTAWVDETLQAARQGEGLVDFSLGLRSIIREEMAAVISSAVHAGVIQSLQAVSETARADFIAEILKAVKGEVEKTVKAVLA